MKTLRQLVIVACALFLVAPRLLAVDDLVAKRADLFRQMRSIGPFPPPDWAASESLIAYNYTPGYGDDLWRPMGNYRYQYLGSNPAPPPDFFYEFIYNSIGAWSYADPSRMDSSVTWADFGIETPTIYINQVVNYWFRLAPESYNAAGLRLESVFVVTGASGSSVTGYPVPRGQTAYTALPFTSARTFDLLQNAETPAFKVADYWFGHFPNFPQDSKLPTDSGQDTVNLTGGGFLLRNIHTWNTNMVWAQEGVYRPGLTLQPGYNAPRLHTYMQQYFSAAYRCDPVTGNLPRTGTLNWDGRGRINTASSPTTGSLIGDGYYFRPNEFGKAVFTTRAQEDGSYGEIPVYTLGLLVDKNRGGTLNTNDVTTAQSPHVFWVNNDSDRPIYEPSPDNGYDELDFDPAVHGTDADFAKATFRIPSRRDLEDYDRLHIPGLKEMCRDLPLGHTVTLAWKQVFFGSPSLFLFQADDYQDGSNAYLTEETDAGLQISPTFYPFSTNATGLSPLASGRVEPGVSLVLHNNNYRATNNFFIYCGTSRGAGELVLEIRKGSQLLGSVSVFLDIRDVKELYERWTVGETKNQIPQTSATLHGVGLPAGVSPTAFVGDNPAQPYILFVHGWNMNAADKNWFGETAFKRLYWQGYTNRFGTFRWPTDYGFSDDIFQAVFDNPVTDPRHYNRSEVNAWKSAEGLRHLLVSLNDRYPGKVNMMAHSMGNITAGEALALQAEKYGGGQILNTYVASQAAVSLHCYNGANNTPAVQLQFQSYDHPSTAIPTVSYGPNSFNVHPDWLATNRVAVGRRVNFYNANDYALAMPAWGFNQILKPDSMRFPLYSYHVGINNLPKIPWVIGPYNRTPAPDPVLPSRARRGLSRPMSQVFSSYFYRLDTPYAGYNVLDFEYRLPDMYEVMALGSESRVMPLGAVGDTVAMVNAVNLQSVWPPDTNPDTSNRNYARHQWHSAQFRMNNMVQRTYWRALLDRRGFIIIDEDAPQ